ncbi:MAG: ribulose-phosphate 3-epimerase [Solirubrobacteraceae bacterium]
MPLPADLAIAPSILSADFARLGAQVDEAVAAGARVIHVDVMDGHFVPPITMGPIVVSALREQTAAAGVLLDVHLMIEAPERQVAEFAAAGADHITFHAEATPHIDYTVQAIHEAGATAGVALTPSTPAAALGDVADVIDLALCMSVNPGWGGQAFIPRSAAKLARMRELLPAPVVLEVDGGIHPGTVGVAAGAGATLLVAGSAVFGSGDPGAAFAALAAAARA